MERGRASLYGLGLQAAISDAPLGLDPCLSTIAGKSRRPQGRATMSVGCRILKLVTAWGCDGACLWTRNEYLDVSLPRRSLQGGLGRINSANRVCAAVRLFATTLSVRHAQRLRARTRSPIRDPAPWNRLGPRQGKSHPIFWIMELVMLLVEALRLSCSLVHHMQDQPRLDLNCTRKLQDPSARVCGKQISTPPLGECWKKRLVEFGCSQGLPRPGSCSVTGGWIYRSGGKR